MAIKTVGLLSPGDMGQAVGGVLRQHGLRVLTCLEGRSERTRALADEAGIADTPSIEGLVEASDLLLCILVPSAALEVAEQVASAIRATGSDLLYADMNAIAPRTARAVGRTIEAAGGRVADGGIIGSPPRKPGTRFYVSGPGAAEMTELRNYGLDIRVIEGDVGQASGLKMCYGALTKGLQALGVELLVAARAMGLDAALRAEQQGSQADLLGWLSRSVPGLPPKAYRWVGEMEEIATCFGDVGLTPKIYEGVADLYRFIAETPIGRESPEESRRRGRDLDTVIDALAEGLAVRS
jgi:3-hydroxyisobutyrate dehydrogenase-like beta-hydroxyacid dehydrogenase